eukprot:200480-Chlamydomonas_euryale.AAC.1
MCMFDAGCEVKADEPCMKSVADASSTPSQSFHAYSQGVIPFCALEPRRCNPHKMTRSALAAKTASGGRAISVAGASLGDTALANAPKQGSGLLWRWDPALSTSILC